VRRRAALAAAAVVAVADLVIHLRPPRWILIALLDHPAHLATAGLVALNLPPRSRRWHAGFLAGALLPDLDHVPLALGAHRPTTGTPRPPTHSLVSAVPLFLLARATRDDLADGVAWGALAHFARDVSMGRGMPALQPFHRAEVRVPYPVYAGALATLTALALSRAEETR
jgi:membrane-bound metal-dependent hydrolase YbcI (DUF457 family)